MNFELTDTLRTTFIYMWTIFVTIIFGVTTVIVSLFSKNGNAPHSVARAWARSIILFSGIKVTVKGLTNIDPTLPYIFMSNHQSNFDIPVFLGFLKTQFRWVAKAELFKIPIFGHGMKGCGYISIDRSNRKSAFKSLKTAAKTIRNGTSVLIFPEGTRSIDGRIKPFKKGGFVLAVESGVPIIPVIIHGTWPIMPKNQLLIKKGHVTLEIKNAIETSNYSRRNKEDLMEKIRNIILDSFNKEK